MSKSELDPNSIPKSGDDGGVYDGTYGMPRPNTSMVATNSGDVSADAGQAGGQQIWQNFSNF